MKNILIFLFFFLMFSFSYGQNSKYELEDIKAFLFYNFNNDNSNTNVAGSFSGNIIDTQDMDLWNTIIGEGSAQGASNQTLIVIKIMSSSEVYDEKILTIICKSDNKTILNQKNVIAAISKDGYYYHAIILNDTGCDNIEITATITDDKILNNVESSLVKNILFKCGE